MACTQPRIALIVAADEPALFFSSVSKAEEYLEAVDVRDGVYTAAFGPRGELFSVGTEGERVVVRPRQVAPRPEQLLELLRQFYTAIGEPMPGADLPMLLDKAAGHISA